MLYRIGGAFALVCAVFGCTKTSVLPADVTGAWKAALLGGKSVQFEFQPSGLLRRELALPGPDGTLTRIETLAQYQVVGKVIRLTQIREGSPGPEGTVSGEMRIPFRFENGRLILYPGTEREMKLDRETKS